MVLESVDAARSCEDRPGARLGWPFLSSRNGHVSLHTPDSLRACAAACGMWAISVTEFSHLFLPPGGSDLARQLVREQADSAIYTASRRGLVSFLRNARVIAGAGRPSL
ncbi:MAG: hypothetical protein K2X74_09410, partial [Acetobacteraceae bacterium]|nr:hypothetical protein [Acetobacteraceae bacterium]